MRRSSLSELALGMRLGVACGPLAPERAGGSAGDKSDERDSGDGEVGNAVAATEGSFRRSE